MNHFGFVTTGAISHVSHVVRRRGSLLTYTLKTCLNDDIYELLHVEIAEHCRNKAPDAPSFLIHSQVAILNGSWTFCH